MKCILTALCFLILPAAAMAGPRLGVEVGGGWVWLDYETEDIASLDFQSRFDVDVAATTRFDLGRSWGLTTGVRYARLGGDIRLENIRSAFNPVGDGYTGTQTSVYQYLSVPVFAQWNPFGRPGPFVFGGLETAWLVDASVEFSDDETSIEDSFPFVVRDPNDELDDFNVSAVIGAGFEFQFGEHTLECAARYGHGLTDIADIDDDSIVPRPASRKTRELALTLGWRM